MKLPLSLLKSFLHTDLHVSQIRETLTLLGIEVERVYRETVPFAGVVVAEVLSTKPHPNAERLKIAEVHDGQKNYEVVCGAPNCRAGLKVAFALPGAVLSAEDGKPIRIEPVKLRGVVSCGMLCSAKELHLSDDHEGIIELPSNMGLGLDLTPILWDPVLELSLTPNLGHCFSALGIARELSAALQIPLQIPRSHFSEQGENPIRASNKTSLCSRYMGRWIQGVKVGPSPFWLQQLLIASGMKPINNVVDVTNYILLKWGQPMHAFDGDKIKGKNIKIGTASSGRPFLCLDGAERIVPEKAILIEDGKKPLAIAGVIGGETSAISSHTSNLFLECAIFDPLSIRNTARSLNLRTESAQRFEKGVDPIGCALALEEACHWMAELSGGKVAQGCIDLKHGSFLPKTIPCRWQRVNQLLGIHLSQTEIENIFQRLHFKTRSLSSTTLEVEVPLFRSDIGEEIDLIEEVARIYGYNNIPKGSSSSTPSRHPHAPMYEFENQLRLACIAQGLQEFLTADLIGPKLAELAQFFSQSQEKPLKTIHSKSEEYSILRSSLLPGLIQVAKDNFDRNNFSISAFELGKIYFEEHTHAVEAHMAALLLTGNRGPLHWSKSSSAVDFYDLKGILENLFATLQVPHFQIRTSQHLSFHPGRQADIYSGEIRIGSFGEVHPCLLEKVGIEQRILYAELDLENMLSVQTKNVRMKPLPQFPASERDWTVSLDLSTQIETIFQAIRSSNVAILENVELIDLYYPQGSNQKNATFRFTYRDPFKTSSFEEVEQAHHKLLAEIAGAR